MKAGRRRVWAGLAVVVTMGLSCAGSEAEEASVLESLEILSPEDGAELPGEPRHSACLGKGPCIRLRLTGRVPRDWWPYLAVGPLEASPRIWIQPRIQAVRRDGTFEGLVYLGTDTEGIGEYFNIFVLAHRNRGQFEGGEELMRLPQEGWLVGDPVRVFRVE